jgi:hypothetical protein
MPYLVPVEVIELLPLPYSGSYGSVAGQCTAHETTSFFPLVTGPSAVLVYFHLGTSPPGVGTPIYVTLGSQVKVLIHLGMLRSYSTACIPGQEISVCQLHCGQLLLVGPLSLAGFLVKHASSRSAMHCWSFWITSSSCATCYGTCSSFFTSMIVTERSAMLTSSFISSCSARNCSFP